MQLVLVLLFHVLEQSRILASGHSFKSIGTGVTSCQVLYHEPGGVPVQGNEVDMRNGGLVAPPALINSGNFRIGRRCCQFRSKVMELFLAIFVRKSLFSNVTPFILALGG
jgi:hypothetical protein